MSLRKVLASGAALSPPGWLADNLCYETMMGSVAYGVSSDTSDVDVYGICLPPKDMVFPHLAGEIHGFGTQIKRFETWQEHHVSAQALPQNCLGGLNSEATESILRQHV